MRDLILAAAARCTGGNVRALAALLGTPERTVRAWMAGTNPVPGAALALFRILAADPAAARHIREDRC